MGWLWFFIDAARISVRVAVTAAVVTVTAAVVTVTAAVATVTAAVVAVTATVEKYCGHVQIEIQGRTIF